MNVREAREGMEVEANHVVFVNDIGAHPRACECWQERKVRERREAKRVAERGGRRDRCGPKKYRKRQETSKDRVHRSGVCLDEEKRPPFRSKVVGS